MRKPNSTVQGDIPPTLVNDLADILALPLHEIFKQVYSTLQWPDSWKTETLTIIPKNSSPTCLGELRNIACTPLFFKSLESFVLVRLREETKLTSKHYGGIKGCGPDHFLTLTWHEIHAALEDNRSCLLYTSDAADE